MQPFTPADNWSLSGMALSGPVGIPTDRSRHCSAARTFAKMVLAAEGKMVSANRSSHWQASGTLLKTFSTVPPGR